MSSGSVAGGVVSYGVVSGGCVSGGCVGVVSGGVVGFVSSGGFVGVVGFSVACGEVGLGSVGSVPSVGPAGLVPSVLSVLFSDGSGTVGFVDVGSDVTGPEFPPSREFVGSVWERWSSEGALQVRSGPLEATESESGVVQPTSTILSTRTIATSFFMITLPFVMDSLLLHE